MPICLAFSQRMYPLCLVFLYSQQGHFLKTTAYLCVLELGQLICLLIPQKGRDTVGWCMVHCDLKLLVLSQTSSCISAPHSGRDWTSQLSFSVVLATK